MTSRANNDRRQETFWERPDQDWESLGLIDASEPLLPGEMPIGQLRRSRCRRDADSVKVVSLIESDDGVLRWELGVPRRRFATGRRAGLRRGTVAEGDVLRELKFESIPPNQIGVALRGMDAVLSPKQGLWTVNAQQEIDTTAAATPASKGRILLLVHGTFSNSDNILEAFRQEPHGQQFLTDAIAKYDQVLAFTHPTLSVSPLLNAWDLAQRFAETKAEVDVICHSRGGLVVRYWREALSVNGPRGRTIFVGSPLAGTSLAAPHRLKEVIDLLSNISSTLAKGTGVASALFPLAAPFMTAAGGLMRIFASVTSVVARTPLADAALSLVPGLCAQSRVGNNEEITRFRAAAATLNKDYFAVQADFMPPPVGWEFWKLFNPRRAGIAVVDAAADAVFQVPNDLVVDTDSMSSISDSLTLPGAQTLKYSATKGVHHLNYFDQKPTFDFLRSSLARPGLKL